MTVTVHTGTSVTPAAMEWSRQFGLLPEVPWSNFWKQLQQDPNMVSVHTATEDQRDMFQANVSVSVACCNVVTRSDFVRAAGNLTLPDFCVRALGSGFEWSQPVIEGQGEGTWTDKVMAPSGDLCKALILCMP